MGVLPQSGRPLNPVPGFLPALLAVVFCFDLMSIYLLVGDYRDNGRVRILGTSWAYLYSLVMVGAYPFVFPGAFLAKPPFGVPPAVAPWLYLGWHVGFPVLLALAWAPWPASITVATAPHRRLRNSAISLAVVMAASLGLVALFVRFADRMPVLIKGVDNSRMATLAGPVALPLVGLSLLVTWFGLRRNTGPERWAVVTVLVALCDLLLTFTSKARYNLGWYAGRSLTFVAAGLVLMAMLAGFRRLKAQAEFFAAYDVLTGLPNRRSVYDALGRLFAYARRARAPLGVVLIDLDLFKSVNDRFGHEAGDILLKAVSTAMAGAVRAGDMVARVGGEEFLALLPGTDAAGALVVAERIRSAIAKTDVPAAGGTATASLGVAELRAEDLDMADLLRRVDHALYQAKEAGRDRSVMAGHDPATGTEAVRAAS